MVALEAEHAQAWTLALTDPLTGLANRRRFDQHLETTIAQCYQPSRPAELVQNDRQVRLWRRSSTTNLSSGKLSGTKGTGRSRACTSTWPCCGSAMMTLLLSSAASYITHMARR